MSLINLCCGGKGNVLPGNHSYPTSLFSTRNNPNKIHWAENPLDYTLHCNHHFEPCFQLRFCSPHDRFARIHRTTLMILICAEIGVILWQFRFALKTPLESLFSKIRSALVNFISQWSNYIIPKHSDHEIKAEVTAKINTGDYLLLFEDASWIPYWFIKVINNT